MYHSTNIFNNVLVSQSTPNLNNILTKHNSTDRSFPIDSSGCDIQHGKRFHRNYKIKPKQLNYAPTKQRIQSRKQPYLYSFICLVFKNVIISDQTPTYINYHPTSHHFLAAPTTLKIYTNILTMYMYSSIDAKIGASIGNYAYEPPITSFVITTKQIPKIAIPKLQYTQVRAGMRVKIAVIPTTKAVIPHTIRIPIITLQFPLHSTAQIVKTNVIPTVASTAIGTTGPSTISTTAEQDILIRYEKLSMKTSSMTISRGGRLASGTHIAVMKIPMMRRMGKMMTQTYCNWKLRQASQYCESMQMPKVMASSTTQDIGYSSTGDTPSLCMTSLPDPPIRSKDGRLENFLFGSRY